ncbi:MAG TPA: hypothetical protein VIJ20_14025, partial [Solirubrobacteraceae bacterium]
MTPYESSRLSEKTLEGTGELDYGARRARRVRRARPLAPQPRTALISGYGHVHARSGRPGKRDRCLILVDPDLFAQACGALGADEDAPEIVFPVGGEPAALRGLLGGSLRGIVEAHGVRRVLIAASGQGA